MERARIVDNPHCGAASLRMAILVLFVYAGSACGSALSSDPVLRQHTAPRARPAQAESVLRPLELRCDGQEAVSVQVQVAQSEFDQNRGLMYRRFLPRDQGMLFVYDEIAPRSFWMENTFISLDVLFFDALRRLVGVVERTRPLSADSIEVESQSQYVLEVGAGFAARHDLGPGCEARWE